MFSRFISHTFWCLVALPSLLWSNSTNFCLKIAHEKKNFQEILWVIKLLTTDLILDQMTTIWIFQCFVLVIMIEIYLFSVVSLSTMGQTLWYFGFLSYINSIRSSIFTSIRDLQNLKFFIDYESNVKIWLSRTVVYDVFPFISLLRVAFWRVHSCPFFWYFPCWVHVNLLINLIIW